MLHWAEDAHLHQEVTHLSSAARERAPGPQPFRHEDRVSDAFRGHPTPPKLFNQLCR